MPDEGPSYPPLFGMSQRLPPANIQAEQALLGAILANNKAHDRVADILRPEHFADPIHARIYTEIDRLIRDGRLADPLTLKGVFEHSGVLEEVGGTRYLAQLLTAMVGIINAGEYARAIHDTWLRRQLIDIGETVVNNAFGADTELDGHAQVTAMVEAGLTLGQQASVGVQRQSTIGDAVDRVLAGMERGDGQVPPMVLLSGLPRLDALWAGMWPGTLDILAGRPGAGKTALALQIARHVAEQFIADSVVENAARQAAAIEAGQDLPRPLPPRTVEFWSMEMSADALATRALAMETRIPYDVIRRGDVTPEQAGKLVVARRAWAALPIVIHDEPVQTLSTVALQARIAVRRNRMGLAISDHAGKYEREKHQYRMQEKEWLNKVASSHHNMALGLNIPWLLLWHISRDQAKREKPRPRMEDLMYAGEGDADNVLLLWRPELLQPEKPEQAGMSEERHAKLVAAWEADKARWAGKAEVVFGKRRSGPTGSVVLGFDGEATRFYDLTPAEPETTPFHDIPLPLGEDDYGE